MSNKKKFSPKPTWTLITPEAAKKYLAINMKNNRNISQYHMDMLARDMKEGRFIETACDPIRISEDGKLIDGQHRMHAVIQSKKSFHFWVIKNIPNRVVDVIDGGMKRTAGHLIAFRGGKNSNAAAAMIRFILMEKRHGSMDAALNRTEKVSPIEVGDLYDRNRARIDSITHKMRTRYKRSTSLIGGSVTNYLYWKFSEKYPAKCDEFFDGLSSGVGLNAGDPRLVLLHVLQKDLIKTFGHKRMSVKMRGRYVVKAFKNFVVGSSITKFKISSLEKTTLDDLPTRKRYVSKAVKFQEAMNNANSNGENLDLNEENLDPNDDNLT